MTNMKLSQEEEDFLLESNRIEGIVRPLSEKEKTAFIDFMGIELPTVADMCNYVKAIQPNAVLRDRVGLNVRVGNHYPPLGDITIKTRLMDILADARVMVENYEFDESNISRDAYQIHQRYETLHPFTDGNGRSGRMLWWWMMGGSSIGFLHRWYYQSLSERK